MLDILHTDQLAEHCGGGDTHCSLRGGEPRQLDTLHKPSSLWDWWDGVGSDLGLLRAPVQLIFGLPL